ncbi:hypothetical protein [Enteractinococcus coprophilus]|uniref:Uncharacterized protein n=1 Tax=Enteractinococcus coprophilus TaxID=1027633 RepID=A0A543AMB2_9MICC|nr:hypothetical protein [Enteractinococcus coprophilus]TQL73701.1 hypothetical protein FB556_0143 [Enteractinococcus coprophilus]
MIHHQNKNTLMGALGAVVAALSALVVVTAIAQMYALTVSFIVAQLAVLGAIGYVYTKAREQKNEMFCASLTVSK